MTYAPPTIVALGRYWTSQGGVNLGIVGDVAHQRKGTSYHLGSDKLAAGAYSARTLRDRNGLSTAASAIDLGRLNGSLGELRAFSSWLVGQARVNAAGTIDIREIIYSPDGRTVLRWDRERGYASLPRKGEADASHLTHTHISFYRDSRSRNKTALFKPYFAPPTYRAYFAPGADVRSYELGTTGDPRCIERVIADTPWGPKASSAPCTEPVDRRTCDGRSGARTTTILAGKLYKGKTIRVGYGVTVEKEGA